MVKLIHIAILNVCFVYTRGQTLDQLITASLRSRAASDFIQDNDTVLVELDIRYSREDYMLLQEAKAEAAALELEESVTEIPDSPGVLGRLKRYLKESDRARVKRKATVYQSKRWTNKIVPYQYAGGFTSTDRAQVSASMNDWNRYTCIRFTPRSNQRNYITIQGGGGCSSYVGMQGTGSQPVTLGQGCRVKSVIIHELGHAIGFQHEQTRHDRDSYITVYSQNIQSYARFNFDKYPITVADNHAIPYDYTSIMHYGQYAFSSNRRPTIMARDPAYQHIMGTSQGHSFRDIKLANIIYSCASHCGSRTCPGEGFLDKNCKCQCPGNPLKECTGGGGGGDEDDDDECTANYALWGFNTKFVQNVADRDACKQLCKDETEFKCKSIDYRNPDKRCTISKEDKTSQPSAFKPSTGGIDYCTVTSEEVSDCEDKNEHCSSWTTAGYCTSPDYTSYMEVNCPLSCESCDTGGGGGGEDKDCMDSHDNCAMWAASDECSANPEWMLENCKKSCDQCEDVGGGSHCKDKNNNCEDWSSSGYCDSYVSYMAENCPKSCEKCNANDMIMKDEFECMSGHYLYSLADSNYWVYNKDSAENDVTQEACATLCDQYTDFNCVAYTFKSENGRCVLSDKTDDDAGFALEKNDSFVYCKHA